MEAYEHNPADHEDPLPGPTWLVGLIGVVLLNVVFLGLAALYYGAADQEAAKLIKLEPSDLVVLRTSQRELIEGSPKRLREMADGKVVAERVVIPVEQAMARIVEQQAIER